MREHNLTRWGLSAALALSLVACSSSDGGSDNVDRSGASADGRGSLQDAGSTNGGGPTANTAEDGGNRLDAAQADAGRGNRGNSRRPMQQCPAELLAGTLPQNGDPCVSGRGACTIDGLTCDCPQDTLKWVCWLDSECPLEPPAERASCPLVEMQCDYGVGSEELECECAESGWDCGRQACPATEPTVGGQCEGGDGVCTFGGRVCDCRSSAWLCWNASDCPSTPPALMSACPLERMLCTYPGDECQCRKDGWECDSHEEEEEDEDEEEADAGAADAGAADAQAPASDAGIAVSDGGTSS